MYERFFELSDRPFSVAPNADYLYLSNNHRRALSLLEYGVTSQTGFSVITGEIGAGKTTILQYIIRKFSQNSLIINVTDTKYFSKNVDAWLLHWFGYDHEETSEIAYRQKVISFFKEIRDENRTCVLIIDEAQYLTADAIEHLRLLANMNEEGQEFFKLILVGQPELRTLLASPRLESFAQRISASFHLNPLTAIDTRGYIRHRVAIAEDNQQDLLNWHLFDDDACDLIFLATDGVPRSINILCDMALVYAYSDEKPYVDREIVRAVLNDRISGLTLDSDIEVTRKLVDQTDEQLRLLRNKATLNDTPGPAAPRDAAPAQPVGANGVSRRKEKSDTSAELGTLASAEKLVPKRPPVAPVMAVSPKPSPSWEAEPLAAANTSVASNTATKAKAKPPAKKNNRTPKKAANKRKTAPKVKATASAKADTKPGAVQPAGSETGKAALDKRMKGPPPASNNNNTDRQSVTPSDETLVLRTRYDKSALDRARVPSFGEFRIEPVETAIAEKERRGWGLTILLLMTVLISVAFILTLFDGWQYVANIWRDLVKS